MPGPIVVVGSINMDLVVRAPRHPQIGETILGSDFQTFPGGKGANQAVAAARLGGQVKMVGRVGTDSFGDHLLANLEKDGVDTSFVRRTEATASGVALITVSEIGQNNIVVVPGANWKLTPEDIQTAEAAFEGAAAVLIQLEIPLDTVEEAARMGRKHGARVLLNPAPAQPLDESLLENVDILIPNELELSLLTGIQSLLVAASSLKSIGIDCLIVTLGSKGVLVLDGEEADHILPHRVSVVDTTAAGDAFVGAFAVALSENQTTREAAIWGNAAGALSVTRAGAQPSLPTRKSLEAFITHHPAVIEKET
ncbi:MAG: ribokinase [Anaerolineaceae bacterium]|nr:ribokinase [Anaerolineaceae bacterium]